MKVDNVIKQYDFNLEYAKALVQDITDDQMTVVPATGLDNHPAFTLGHLIAASADLARDLGAEFQMPKHWAELFIRKGPGDPRKPNLEKGKYPQKLELIQELEVQHNKVKRLLKDFDVDKLEEPMPWRFSNFMPRLIDLIAFMCINHEAMHLGQLAAWRRSMGLVSALAAVKHNKKR